MIHTIDLHFQQIPKTIAAFIVESSEGPILVETGPHSTFPQLKKGIEKLGYRIEEIQHVLLTHIHLDHAGSSWAFAENGAVVYVHPLGYGHLNAPERLMESAARIYKDQMHSLWGQMKPIPEQQPQKVENGEVITIGQNQFTAWHTPGHAVHHIAWQLNDKLFCGDVAGVKVNGGPVVPPCPPPDINLEDWKQSIELMRNLELSSIYLTHFGEIKDWKTHLNALERVLNDWANWILPHFKAGREMNDIIPDFQNHVKQSLLDAGLTQEGLAQYEAANPSWMSVAGLLRYWKKRLP
ncbi:MAG: MBL fold hydrolase [Saprospiraceae bacterium]|nr:MAG: MBL fold hydrolase [Saprospiraceae bacterium]